MQNKFRIQVVLSDGKVHDEFIGSGEESYNEMMTFAKKIASIYNGKVCIRVKSDQFIIGKPFPLQSAKFLKSIDFEYDDYTLTHSELCGLLERYKHQHIE
jgi:hypothetical protein